MSSKLLRFPAAVPGPDRLWVLAWHTRSATKAGNGLAGSWPTDGVFWLRYSTYYYGLYLGYAAVILRNWMFVQHCDVRKATGQSPWCGWKMLGIISQSQGWDQSCPWGYDSYEVPMCIELPLRPLHKKRAEECDLSWICSRENPERERCKQKIFGNGSSRHIDARHVSQVWARKGAADCAVVATCYTWKVACQVWPERLLNVLNERYERYKVDKCCSIVVATLADGQFGNRVRWEDSFSCTEVFISKRANVQDPVRETGPFDNTHGGKDWSSLMETADYLLLCWKDVFGITCCS